MTESAPRDSAGRAVARGRAKTVIATLGMAVSLALAGPFLPTAKLQAFTWGAFVGLLLTLALAGLGWLRRTGVTKPEAVRGKIRARTKWIKIAASAGALVGIGFPLFSPHYLSANTQSLIIGVSFGVIIFMALLIGPAFWTPAKPKRPERSFSLEPMQDPNRIQVRHPPRRPN
jgi:hypothetical protein